MKRKRRILLTAAIVAAILVVTDYLIRPQLTMWRIASSLGAEPPGATGPIFEAVSEYDRPRDVLNALWELTLDTENHASEAAGFCLALIARKELNLSPALKISESNWWKSWGDFMVNLEGKSNLSEREKVVLDRIRQTAAKQP